MSNTTEQSAIDHAALNASRPGRIPDLESARIRAEYWIRACREATDSAEAILYMEQAMLAWKNAAYWMADQRDAVVPQCVNLVAKMQEQWHDSDEENSGHWMDAAQMIEDKLREKVVK